jgi:hypothetical protein
VNLLCRIAVFLLGILGLSRGHTLVAIGTRKE